MSRFTDDDLRAAFQFRASGTPRPDLRPRIKQATRPTQQRPALVVILGTRSRRPILARLVAIAAVAAVLIGAGSGVGHGLEQLVGRPTPQEGTSVAVAAAIEDDEGDDDEGEVDDEENEADDGEDEGDDDDVDEELERDQER